MIGKRRLLLKDTLIIKLGALGDVLRTTTILNALEGNITWITKPNAKPLLENIPHINHLVEGIKEIAGNHFDTVLSLDDDIAGCRMLKEITFDRLYGFYENNGKILPMPESREWWAMSLNGSDDRDERKQANRKSFQYSLFKNIGLEFKGQDYIFGYEPKEVKKNIVGLEDRAGDRWPMKIWPYYAELGDRLRNEGFKVKIFKQKKDIRDYIADVNSCRVVVSGDSLAMHVALALKKKVVALFGPTNPYEIEMYGRGTKLHSDMPCISCYKKIVCEKKPNCMESLDVETVYDSIKRLLQ